MPDKETQEQAVIAREVLATLSSAKKHRSQGPVVTLVVDKHREVFAEASSGQRVRIPNFMLKLLRTILEETANGNAVTVMPVGAEFTTQQAAEFLNVSRPFVIKLLESGKIPFRMVGNRRKVLFEELKKFRQVDDERRRKIADEMTAEAQGQGFY